MHITRQIVISTAHRIFEYNGRCERLHGHNYRILLSLTADSLDDLGMIVDFGRIKRVLLGALDEAWDHRTLLFEQDPLAERLKAIEDDGSVVVVPFNPTAENMATHLATEFFPRIMRENGWDPRVVVHSVTVYETENSCATWTRSQGA